GSGLAPSADGVGPFPVVGHLALLADPDQADGVHRKGLACGRHAGMKPPLPVPHAALSPAATMSAISAVMPVEAAQKMRAESRAPARVIGLGGRRNPPAASDDAGAAVP